MSTPASRKASACAGPSWGRSRRSTSMRRAASPTMRRATATRCIDCRDADDAASLGGRAARRRREGARPAHAAGLPRRASALARSPADGADAPPRRGGRDDRRLRPRPRAPIPFFRSHTAQCSDVRAPRRYRDRNLCRSSGALPPFRLHRMDRSQPARRRHAFLSRGAVIRPRGKSLCRRRSLWSRLSCRARRNVRRGHRI